MYLIRDFSNRVECQTIDDLMQCLQTDFSGMSISVQFTLKSGVKRCVFIDVLPDGLIDSYTGIKLTRDHFLPGQY